MVTHQPSCSRFVVVANSVDWCSEKPHDVINDLLQISDGCRMFEKFHHFKDEKRKLMTSTY